MLGRRAHCELIHIRLTNDRQTSFVDLLHDRCVIRRTPIAQNLRRTRRRDSAGHHVVFQSNRNTRKAVQFLAGLALRINLGRGLQSALAVDEKESIDLRIQCLNTVQARSCQFNRRDLTCGQHVSQLKRGLLQQFVHHSSPRICGTRNIPSSLAGACERTSSRSRVSVTTSSRQTFVSGIG